MFDGCEDRYLQVGLSALNVIKAALLGAPAPQTILDLPCGFGRVTRILRARYPDAAITVCDLDRSGVDFAAATFGARGIYSKPDFQALQLGSTFDLIWVGSLLTHLPEHQTRQFLDFAARHMGPDSRLVVTSHGEHVVTRMRSWSYGLSEPAARGLIAQYLKDGYAYRGYDGDSSYGISLVARSWYEALLAGSPLRLQSYYDRGWDRHQDVLVIRRASGRVAAVPFFGRPDIPLPLPGPEQAAQDEAGVPGFDEAWYCGAFADVAAAVRDGTYLSGLAHHLAYGWKEGRPPFEPQRSYARRTPPVPEAWLDGIVGGANRINETWSVSPEDQAADAGWYWMAHPAVRARSNRLASGDPSRDAYDRLAALLEERGWALPIPRSISIGCGFGGLERDLSTRGIVSEMDAYDIAAGAVVEAERQARQLGLLRVRYHVADLERIDLSPSSVDVVFAHSSVHHVERLDALYATVRRALRPGGVLHLHEYVGPTRFQWTDAQLRLANGFLDSLPPRLRRLPNGEPKETLRRPTIEEMIAADPSEAVQSEKLIPALAPHFDIIEHRSLGGALAHLALGGIAQNFDPASPEDNAFLQALFDMEDAAMAAGTIGSDFATITALPKPFGKRQQAFAMARSLTARAAALFSPARRLHETVRV
ncbi:methyltransferase domain-containing protein [Belnapia sp. T18]|uniref:Methyltransferase domain-containing protein n=1 Tax=Belnapia arida TaxID=2804533 RepID=A0ABS1UBK9_9PROT|nr:class I SAM-dependent methyltransferase [Belnapia arida]MBL6082071.1 methyltransferase domain-containing protein [Belnapia arida]